MRWRRSRRELPDGVRALLDGDARRLDRAARARGRLVGVDTRASVESSRLTGAKAAVEHADAVDYLAVVAHVDGELGLALVSERTRRGSSSRRSRASTRPCRSAE